MKYKISTKMGDSRRADPTSPAHGIAYRLAHARAGRRHDTNKEEWETVQLPNKHGFSQGPSPISADFISLKMAFV